MGQGRFLKLVEWLDRRGKNSLLAAGFLGILVVGCIDSFAPAEFPLALFYLPSIGLISWAGGAGSGMAAALTSTVAWYLSEAAYGKQFPLTYEAAWIAGTRLGFFTVVSWLVSSLQMVLREERKNARTDPMTDAANTRYFRELLGMEIERSARYGETFTLVYLDLDNFKQVNDRLGHQAGDELLRAVVTSMKRHLRAVDFVGRLGGDEFAALLPETGQQAARALLSRLLPALRQEIAGHGWAATCSVGVITCRDMCPSVDEMLRQADELMYSVKRSGKDGVAYGECGGGASSVGTTSTME